MVIGHHAADGYVSSSKLLTRRSHDNDFATATCVRRAGINPDTGHRYLEDLAFAIFFEQPREYACARAHDVVTYGVRRMFAIFGTERRPDSDVDGEVDYTMAEWSADRDDWIPLAPDHVISGPCLFPDIPVEAFVDARASKTPQPARSSPDTTPTSKSTWPRHAAGYATRSAWRSAASPSSPSSSIVRSSSTRASGRASTGAMISIRSGAGAAVRPRLIAAPPRCSTDRTPGVR